MKKYRLTKISRVIITLMVILLSLFIHHLMADFGAKLQSNINYLPIVVLGWIWLLLGQFGVFYKVWEVK